MKKNNFESFWLRAGRAASFPQDRRERLPLQAPDNAAIRGWRDESAALALQGKPAETTLAVQRQENTRSATGHPAQGDAARAANTRRLAKASEYAPSLSNPESPGRRSA